MTTVRIQIGKSEIHGLGCFSSERIEAGQMVWTFNPDLDLVMKEEFLNSLPQGARENLLNYAFVSRRTGDYILCSDDSKFTNHSDQPNVKCLIPECANGNELECFAVKTILPGEEITNDYRDFDAEPTDVIK